MKKHDDEDDNVSKGRQKIMLETPQLLPKSFNPLEAKNENSNKQQLLFGENNDADDVDGHDSSVGHIGGCAEANQQQTLKNRQLQRLNVKRENYLPKNASLNTALPNSSSKKLNMRSAPNKTSFSISTSSSSSFSPSSSASLSSGSLCSNGTAFINDCSKKDKKFCVANNNCNDQQQQQYTPHHRSGSGNRGKQQTLLNYEEQKSTTLFLTHKQQQQLLHQQQQQVQQQHKQHVKCHGSSDCSNKDQ